MAFDSNPQAVFHGLGFAQTRSVATLVTDQSSTNTLRAPTVSGSYTIPDDDRVLMIRVEHAGANNAYVMVVASDIPSINAAAAPTAANSIAVGSVGTPAVRIANLNGSLAIGSSADISGNVTVQIREIR